MQFIRGGEEKSHHSGQENAFLVSSSYRADRGSHEGDVRRQNRGPTKAQTTESPGCRARQQNH